MEFKENTKIPASKIAELRSTVGWGGMESSYASDKMTSYYHIAAFDGDILVGFVDCVSNNVTDAYIQDLIVRPEYHGKGIGTELMNRMINYLKSRNIFMISVLFEEKLMPFYKRFGFNILLCGQMQTYELDE